MQDTKLATAQNPSRSLPAVLHHAGVRQFVKFCIVGASSTAISTGIFYILVYQVQLDKVMHLWLMDQPRLQTIVDTYRLYIQAAALVGFIFGVTNGFYWNTRWTFRQKDPTRRRSQYVKFVSVNIVGLTLNQIILFVVNSILTAGKTTNEKGWEPMIAFFVATGIVVFWNFFANKHWTYKKH